MTSQNTGHENAADASPKTDSQPETPVTTKLGRSVKSGIEFCGKHPFATGLFALVGVLGLMVSIYGFSLDRVEARETGDQIVDLDEKVDVLNTEISQLDPNVRDAAIETPVKIDFGRWGDQIDTVIFPPNEVTDSAHAADRSARMRFIYNKYDSVSSSPLYNFSVSSIADKNFVQIAPYVLIDVIELERPPMQLEAFYLGERGGGAVLREFYGALAPVEGIQVAPLSQRTAAQKIDFITLEPGEVEEFHLNLQYYPDHWFEFRIGLQIKFNGRPATVWGERVYRRGNVSGSIPTITWSNETPEVMPYPDGEYSTMNEVTDLYYRNVRDYTTNRVFQLEQAGLELAHYAE